MSLTPNITPWRIKTIPGMNTKLEDLELQTNWVEKAQNCRFEEKTGTTVKRKPISYFNSTKIGTDPIVGLYRYYTSNGTTLFVSAAGTGVYVGNDPTGTFTQIRTLNNSGKHCSFIVYNDLIMGFNGYDHPFVYDGSTDNVTWELSSCKAKVGSGTGITGTNIVYTITYDTDAIVTGALSNAVTVTNQDVELTNIPLGPVGCENRKIYRKSDETAGDYRLVATLPDNTTTTYTDTDADVSGEDNRPVVTDEFPKGNIPVMFRERLFLAGDPNNPNTVYYSYPFLPHIMLQITGPDTLEVAPDDGDEITGLAVYGGFMTCIKKNNIRQMYVAGPDSSWYAQDPLTNIGTPAPWSVVTTMNGIVFLGWNHWYICNGQTVQLIIDEFDTADILPAHYADTVSYYHEDHILAAYTDTTLATQYHNRVMRYNTKRLKLSYDTINANCFAAKRGGDETGELYYGSSIEGYVFKGSNEELTYRLNTKTQVKSGTSSDVFIGGTESSPYIEIGSVVTASSIPNNICIFWDNVHEVPGSGWTEITTFSGSLIKIDTTYGSATGSATHTHSVINGLFESTTPGSAPHGKTGTPGDEWVHTHTITEPTVSDEAGFPRHFKTRVFYKNPTTVEYKFPVGAIVLWDQSVPPDGWQNVTDIYSSISEYYVRIGTADLFIAASPSHKHTLSGTSSTMVGGHVASTMSTDAGGTTNMALNHTHSFDLRIDSNAMADWELDYVKFNMIKKISSEENTWDGHAYYAYCLYTGVSDPGNDWTIDSTYAGKYLKIGPDSPTTGAAQNGTHTHELSNTISGSSTPWGGGDDYDATDAVHTHNVTATFGDTNPDPLAVTFRIVKKILGKCQDYNSAIADNSITSGTWTSSSMQVNATSLGRLFWNESVEVGDDVHLHFRAGTTQGACEGSAWSTAIENTNGVDLATYITANTWVQFMIQFNCVDSIVANPRVYFADGYLVKFLYSQSAILAEDSVEFIYSVGYRNFDMPMVDKVHKKIGTIHEGSYGSFKVMWETELNSNEFVISLADNPKKWNSFFHDTAYGEKMDITIYKNDLYDFTLKELNGLFVAQPMLI